MQKAVTEEIKSFTYDLDCYGFSTERIVRLNKPQTIPIPLSSKSSSLLNMLFENERIALNEALEVMAKAVNDSMVYDISKAINEMLDRVTDFMGFKCDDGIVPDSEFLESLMGPVRTLAESVERTGYEPGGTETYFGICTDAGQYIRYLIEHSIDDPSLRYHKLHIRNGYSGPAAVIGGHDATLVFDTNSGNWVVINSKSPRLLYNVVPKENLSDLYL